MENDLVLTGGRVIDPSQGIDRVTDLAFCKGKVSEVGDGLTARIRRDVSGQIVTPGLIDLHTHVYWGGTSLGVDPDSYAYQSAVTTTVDAGSAGPGNFPGFKAHMIDPAQSRILAYLHVSFAGIYAFSPTIMVGESHDMRLMAAREAVAVAKAHRDNIIKSPDRPETSIRPLSGQRIPRKAVHPTQSTKDFMRDTCIEEALIRKVVFELRFHI